MLVALTPPVGTNRTSGKGPASDSSKGIPPTASAGKSLSTESP